ncbi:MAG TPA: hypothetical protein VFV50_02175, partial [Bdellovibrionales bacterium]|nr:hypothetical protein [Bdellovibrionales bacterium]
MSASELRGIRSISTGLPLPTERAQTPDAGFKDLLKDETVTGQNPAAKTEAAKLQFSNHAVDRMRSRGISMEPADVERLGQAIEKAQAKGSRETLVLMGDNAFI